MAFSVSLVAGRRAYIEKVLPALSSMRFRSICTSLSTRYQYDKKMCQTKTGYSHNYFIPAIHMKRHYSHFVVHHSSFSNENDLGDRNKNMESSNKRVISTNINNERNEMNSSPNKKDDHEPYLRLLITTPEDMEDVGSVLSISSSKGDIIFLDGDLGAGKTCFSRGFIRAKTGFFDMKVTSPTYLLSNVYDTSDNIS